MDAVESRFLFKMDAELEVPFIPVGASPEGLRVVANLAGGTFEGPKLKGTIARSGADWGLTRPDGSFKIDVRCCLIPEEGTPIYMHYFGRIVIYGQDLLTVLADPAKVAALKPSDYYFRSAPTFEVAMDSPHAWLNGIQAVGVGTISDGGISYRVYEVL